MNAMENELNNAKQLTENGAVGYRTTGKKLLDLNFSVSSLRHKSEQEIINQFMDAYYENSKLAIKYLFYLRDVTQGLGERRSFRVIINYLAEQHTDITLAVLELIPEYGRFDDLIGLLDCNNAEVSNKVLEIIAKQLKSDMIEMKENHSISLLAKWMPSSNCSSKDTKRKAIIIRNYLGWDERKYRKTLSALRNHLNVVECKMSAKEWENIDKVGV